MQRWIWISSTCIFLLGLTTHRVTHSNTEDQHPQLYPGGGAHIKILTGVLVIFFWVWNLTKSYFSELANFSAIFSGFYRIFASFVGLTNFQLFLGSSHFCITHLNPLNEEHTTLRNKIIVAFHIYSNFDHHCIWSHSIFGGLNFGAFYFLGLNLGSFYFFG